MGSINDSFSTINFRVTGQTLSRIDNNEIIANCKNYYVCHFEIPSEWETAQRNGAVITATFDNNRVVYSAILENNSCKLPVEILRLTDGATILIGLFIQDDDTIVTTTLCKTVIAKGTPSHGIMSQITPTLYEQIMQRISEISSGQINPDVVERVVSDYLEAHPISDDMIYSAIERYFSEHDIPTPTPTPDEPTKTLSSISATKTKTSYDAGETLNTNDITVIAHYSDNTTANVTNVSTINTSNVNMETEGNYNIQVSYTEDGITKNATIAISVAAPIVVPPKTLSSISATKTKSTYNVGETLETSDIIVTAHYSDNTTADVTNTSTITTSNVDMMAEGDYNIEISYTEDDITKNATIAISVIPVNIIDVGIGNEYLYHTIKSAESAVANGGKIRIHEGTYDEYALGTSSKAITYEGVDKDTCIVQNGLSDKMYSVFDLCGGNKTVKNLTIHQTHSDPQNPNTTEVAYKAYSVHCDMPSCENHKYVVDNCILKNRYFACCGFGTWQDTEIVVKDCDIDLYDSNRDITGTGAYYCHGNTYSDGVTGQKISLVNNTIHADQSLAIRIDSSKRTNSEMICEFINNTCSSDLYGSTNDCVSFTQNDYTTLTETSTGNNIPVLNYGVEDEEYTAPEGLKDTGYWFVVYDKTKDKYYAGNYTKSITRGYKNSNTKQLAFSIVASNSGKINGWTSTDGQTWTQVTTNQPTYGATTAATNTNSDTQGKYAFGSGQYDDDIILVDAWSDSEFSWEY